MFISSLPSGRRACRDDALGAIPAERQPIGAPVPLEHAGYVLHAAGDKRQYSQTDQQEKQKHARRIGQGKQQRSQ
jgi:hypothetical protein